MLATADCELLIDLTPAAMRPPAPVVPTLPTPPAGFAITAFKADVFFRAGRLYPTLVPVACGATPASAMACAFEHARHYAGQSDVKWTRIVAEAMNDGEYRLYAVWCREDGWGDCWEPTY